jgi:hypothetical protein
MKFIMAKRHESSGCLLVIAFKVAISFSSQKFCAEFKEEFTNHNLNINTSRTCENINFIMLISQI